MNDPTNYHGIAIQSSEAKLLDNIITERLYQYLESTIKSTWRGTISNLLEISQMTLEELAAHYQIDIINLDLSRAFDWIDHNLLAAKPAKLATPRLLRHNHELCHKSNVHLENWRCHHQPRADTFELCSTGPAVWLVIIRHLRQRHAAPTIGSWANTLVTPNCLVRRRFVTNGEIASCLGQNSNMEQIEQTNP